eukprot:1809388-Pyramimonas_sp.AAC.1
MLGQGRWRDHQSRRRSEVVGEGVRPWYPGANRPSSARRHDATRAQGSSARVTEYGKNDRIWTGVAGGFYSRREQA